jgi:hypothetical protein
LGNRKNAHGILDIPELQQYDMFSREVTHEELQQYDMFSREETNEELQQNDMFSSKEN